MAESPEDMIKKKKDSVLKQLQEIADRTYSNVYNGASYANTVERNIKTTTDETQKQKLKKELEALLESMGERGEEIKELLGRGIIPDKDAIVRKWAKEDLDGYLQRGGEAKLLSDTLEEFRRQEEGEREYKKQTAPTAKGVLKTAGVVAAAAGSAAVLGVPLAPESAKGRIRNEAYNAARKKAVEMLRKGPDGGESGEDFLRRIDEDAQQEVSSIQSKYSKVISPEEAKRLIKPAFESAAEQVGYYEQEYRTGIDASKNKYLKRIPLLNKIHPGTPGVAVRNMEQAGAAASTLARKTPVVGGLLTGKVPTQPAQRTERLDPNVRSAMNAARLELQKVARDIFEKGYKNRLNDIQNEAGQIKLALEQKNRQLEKVNSKIKAIIAESKSGTANSKPGDQPDGGGTS